MKKLVLLIALLVLSTACDPITEHGKEMQKMELKERQLEYLEKLYRIKK